MFKCNVNYIYINLKTVEGILMGVWVCSKVDRKSVYSFDRYISYVFDAGFRYYVSVSIVRVCTIELSCEGLDPRVLPVRHMSAIYNLGGDSQNSDRYEWIWL